MPRSSEAKVKRNIVAEHIFQLAPDLKTYLFKKSQEEYDENPDRTNTNIDFKNLLITTFDGSLRKNMENWVSLNDENERFENTGAHILETIFFVSNIMHRIDESAEALRTHYMKLLTRRAAGLVAPSGNIGMGRRALSTVPPAKTLSFGE